MLNYLRAHPFDELAWFITHQFRKVIPSKGEDNGKKARWIAEQAYFAHTGKKLPKGSHVHHMDRNRANNDPSNLVICQDAETHNAIHARGRELGIYPPHQKPIGMNLLHYLARKQGLI